MIRRPMASYVRGERAGGSCNVAGMSRVAQTSSNRAIHETPEIVAYKREEIMTSTSQARAGVALAFGLIVSGGGLSEARAQTVTANVSSACVLQGTSPIAKGTQLFDAASGGAPIARFTGNMVPMRMTELPADPANGRAKLSTSTGSGALRIEGYVDASVVPMFTTRDVPVMAGNVWIASGQKVRLVHGGPGALRVEKAVAGSRSQNVTGTTTCEGLALSLPQSAPPAPSIPQSARTFLTKNATTDIFDRPNGDAVFSLQMLEGSSQLFWSTETRAGFVHVTARADIVIDGWIRWRDLEPLKRGEMMGTDYRPHTPPAAAQLVFEDPPRLATAPKDIPVRAKRSEKAKPIGMVETGAQIYIMETVAGWTNVLPKALHILPPEDGGFWIPASDVPK